MTRFNLLISSEAHIDFWKENDMETTFIVLHYLICFVLIVVILLQSGKGADIGSLFGGASQTVFGGRGPTTFLNKLTAIIAAGFFVTSLWLAHSAKNQTGKTVIDQATPTEQTIPAIPTKKTEGTQKKVVTKKTGTSTKKAPVK